MIWLRDAVFKIIGIFFALTFHEYIKALTSSRLGDIKPRSDGKLTLNPFKHFEPIGFIFMFAYGYGWAKPVETTATYYSDRKKGTLITYTMPIAFNLLLSVTFAVLYNVINMSLQLFNVTSSMVVFYAAFSIREIVKYIAIYNFFTAIFNIIPVYPLDGAKILSVFLSPNTVIKLNSYEKIFQVILIILLFAGFIDTLFTPFTSLFFMLFR